MSKTIHEIRDPIHIFIKLDTDERKVLDSRPFQRLRYIHQLALTYLVYPGATNRRFEHSLGVMELSGRVYDVVTNPDNITDKIKGLIPEILLEDKKRYWRRVLRMAALCHDIGHLPFSHASEKDLLPEGWDHERLTRELITSEEMENIWKDITPPLRSEDIVKLAVGNKKAPDLVFSDWETILAEIITGDAFGVDRIDYLLRDSLHTGVAYGRFDHYRLIDTLRILPPATIGETGEMSTEPALGIEHGGIQSAEALLLARYFMFSQVYCHHVRRIYDIHLRDFLLEWLPNEKYPVTIEEHLEITDSEIISGLNQACKKVDMPGHSHADRIINRKHFKRFYERTPNDIKINPDAVKLIKEAAEEKFGKNNIRYDRYIQENSVMDFPVLLKDDSVVSSLSLSQVLGKLPVVAIEYVFVDPNPDLMDKVKKWLYKNKKEIISQSEEEYL